jgi:hypothetical protein
MDSAIEFSILGLVDFVTISQSALNSSSAHYSSDSNRESRWPIGGRSPERAVALGRFAVDLRADQNREKNSAIPDQR